MFAITTWFACWTWFADLREDLKRKLLVCWVLQAYGIVGYCLIAYFSADPLDLFTSVYWISFGLVFAMDFLFLNFLAYRVSHATTQQQPHAQYVRTVV
jgi:hypothetical protein